MGKFRYYLFLAVGIIFLGITSGLRPALYVLLGVVLAVGSNKLAGVISKHSMHSSGKNHSWTVTLIGIFELGTLLISLIAAIMLKVIFGWIPAIAIVILILGYYPLRWEEDDESKERTKSLRDALHKLVEKGSTGQLTKEQLEIQADFLLSRGFIRDAYQLQFLIDPLLDQSKLSNAQYKLYLSVMDSYLTRVSGHYYNSTPLCRSLRSSLDKIDR